jgi:ribosomal protein S18 acetylase RimI-like enzyme
MRSWTDPCSKTAVWTERLRHQNPAHKTVVAEERGALVGFVHTILDDHPVWRALVDNLHVAAAVKRQGIGRELLARSASAVLARGTNKRLYLMVLETNTYAQAFYSAAGGECVGSETSDARGGGSTVVGLRYVWRDPSVLLSRR